jgi:2-keto-4-pentenoate hydratase/2-oxohepta-3-ene-1,7-dioic acid hydratase in catechol pathway
MRIVVFGPQKRVGLLHEQRVMDINNAVRAHLATELGPERAALQAASAAPSDLCAFIAAGQPALDLAAESLAKLAKSTAPGLFVPIESAALAAPWPGKRIACAGANYADHIQRMMAAHGQSATLREIVGDWRAAGPQGFFKVPHEVMGPEGEIPYPSRTTRLDYEAEVAVVIGRQGKDIPLERAAEYIWGVTLFNDWTDRDGIRPSKLPLTFNLAKNFDGSASLGPCICVGELDPQQISISLSVNGRQRQSFSTRDMLFSFAEYIACLSRDFTLVPGDIIAGGTAAGTAIDSSSFDANRRPLPELFLQVGDAVEIASPSIGVLRNRIVAKT